MGSSYSAPCAVTVAVALLLNPIQAEEYSYIVHDGVPNVLRCLAPRGSLHRWTAARVQENSIGPPIDIRGFETRERTLRFITDHTVNTGLYRCVDALDESVVFDEYVILTERERLWISPSPILRVNSSGKATIIIHFVQFKGTPEHLYAFHVDWTSNTSSERLGLISESKIVNGTARFSFSTTHNGSISVVAEFRVGHILPQNHRVTSDAVQVILETEQKPVEPTSVKDQVLVKPASELGPGTIAGIVFGAVALLGLLVVVYLATGLGAILHQRRRGQRPIENGQDPEHMVMIGADPQQNVEDEEDGRDDGPNPQDNPAGPNILPDPRLCQLLQNVEDRDEERDDEPNPQDRPASPNVPLDIEEQNESASVNTHAEEQVGLDGQESVALAPVPSAS